MKRAVYAALMSKSASFGVGKRAAFIAAAEAAGLRTSMPGLRTMVASDNPGDVAAISVLGMITPRRFTEGSLAREQHLAAAYRDVASRLIKDWWGDYVAIGDVAGDAGPGVLRAPFGNLACYWAEWDDHVLIASSAKLLHRFLARPPVIEPLAIAEWLAAVDLNTGRTCLADIRELTGGQLLHLTAKGVEIEQLWSPWSWTDRRRRFATCETAAAAVRDAISEAVAGRVPSDEPAVLLLSGGLDSSIVAAALAANGRSFDCITMAGTDALGDERVFAQAMAQHVGSPWAACDRELAAIDLTRPLAAALPRPSGTQFRQASLKAARSAAAARGARSIIDGGGGDNMFCSLQSATPVVDHFLASGPGRDVLATAKAIAQLADVSVIAVLRQGINRLIEQRIRYHWPTDYSFLNRAVVPAAACDHAWLVPPSGIRPGTAAQVGLLLAATAVSSRVEDHELPITSPLVAQPIAEAVLRVPIWMWFEHGRNRAIVRRAFANELPEPVSARRDKGTPAAFMAKIFEERRAALRPFLLDGLLAAHDLLDRPALERALADDRPARDLSFARVLQITDAEAWVRSWA